VLDDNLSELLLNSRTCYKTLNSTLVLQSSHKSESNPRFYPIIVTLCYSVASSTSLQGHLHEMLINKYWEDPSQTEGDLLFN